MNLSNDKVLETFLKENRPLHPRHSEREADRIWRHIAEQKKTPLWTWPRLAYGFAATLIVLTSLYFSQPLPESTVSLAEVSLIDESLELKFLENGEIYEVSDLLSLSK